MYDCRLIRRLLRILRPLGDSIQRNRTESERARERERTREGQRHRIHARPRLHISRELPKEPQLDMSQVPLISAEERTSQSNPLNLVTFEVGQSKDTWTYNVERQRLAERSEWFRAMLLGPLAPTPTNQSSTVQLQHVEKRAFNHLIGYLLDEPIDFMSIDTARATLDVAHESLCPEAARQAAKFLEANLSSSTVLQVFQGLDLYADNALPTTSAAPGTPTAPPAPGDDAGEIATACAGLLAACLAIIDSDPVTVLRQERFEELSLREVEELASRDSLQLAQEGVLFSALERWAAAQCRRLGVEPTPCNKRSVLADEVWYSVRYPLMTDREFIEGPMASGILSSEESAFIVARILGHHEERERGLQHQNSVTRPLSRLSSVPRAGTPLPVNSKSKMSKPGKREREENKRNRRRECASQGQRACARIGDCLVRVLACVFD